MAYPINLGIIQSCDTGEGFAFQQFQAGPAARGNVAHFVSYADFFPRLPQNHHHR